MLHTHLTRDDRVRLSVLLRVGHSQAECARQIGKDPSAVSRELSWNGGRIQYDVRYADKKARERRWYAKKKYHKIMNDRRLRRHIVRKLKKYWSPEQIAGRLKRISGRMIVVHETIYQFVYVHRPDLKHYLRQRGKKRHRYGTRMEKTAQKDAYLRRIDKRPSIVEKRKRIGDWEGDTIIGKERTQRILTHVERMSGYVLADKMETVTCDRVREIVSRRMEHRPCYTMTYDNGSEFALHRLIENDVDTKVYFAYPGRPYERGSNENANGLLRQFFPKRSSFATIKQKDVYRATVLLNNRPRKRLGYLTPREVYFSKVHHCVSR